MKRLLFHIIVFLAPLVILLIFMPVNKRMKYLGLKNDCFNHGTWIHDRIHVNPDPVDIAFLGSSHTINGINDMVLSEKLGGLKALNFGYCRLGRNLDYVLLKEILKTKKINKLVIEVREREDRYSHPVFPFVASTADVLLPNPFFNRDIFKDYWKHLSYKVEICQDMLFKSGSIPDLRLEDYGFAGHNDTAVVSLLEEAGKKRSLPKAELSSFQKKFYLQYPIGYFQRIARICRENGISLYFLYLPSYGNFNKTPEALQLYEEWGIFLKPPGEILDDPSNWHDENHLNNTGAQKLSEWLSGELIVSGNLSSSP